MLTCKVGKQIVNTIDYRFKEIKKWSNKGILRCPICDSQMIFRNGLIKIPHFSHKEKRECDYGFWENETKEHHLGKVHIYNWLSSLSDVTNLKLEAWIPETKQRPDLMFDLHGDTYVIEYQCSNMTIETFLEREKLYNLMGIKSIWILGTETFKKKKKKALELELKRRRKLYYYDPYNEELVKDSFNGVFIHNINITGNNFYIENNEIMTPIEIDLIFKEIHRENIFKLSMKESKIRRESTFKKEKEDLKYHLWLRNFIRDEFYLSANPSGNYKQDIVRFENIIRTKIEEYNELINSYKQFINDKTIYIYSDYNLIKNTCRKKNIRFISNTRGDIDGKNFKIELYEKIIYNKYNEIHILLPNVDLHKSWRWLRVLFDKNEVVIIVESEDSQV